MALEGYLENNRQLEVERTIRSSDSRFVELTCSMKNLEELDLFGCELTLEDLAHVFQSCSQITNLSITGDSDEMPNMTEHLKNQLRPGFHKLRRLDLRCSIYNDSWLVLQEMLT
jgi:hypothetical protein